MINTITLTEGNKSVLIRSSGAVVWVSLYVDGVETEERWMGRDLKTAKKWAVGVLRGGR